VRNPGPSQKVLNELLGFMQTSWAVRVTREGAPCKPKKVRLKLAVFMTALRVALPVNRKGVPFCTDFTVVTISVVDRTGSAGPVSSVVAREVEVQLTKKHL
jgi:hypothetical protein